MKLLIMLVLVFGLSHSEELDELLNTYTHNSDLSQKTKLENGGIMTVFTRKDLDIMQARSLKDILKSNPLYRYTENRNGNPDMLYDGGTAPISSSVVRIYINNQELTSATYGSIFKGAGNINLDAIDHIEIYSGTPSYEFTSEPTNILIKLYTKIAERDRGGKLGVSYGSLGFNEESMSYAQEFEDFSYFTSLYRTDNKRKTYYSHDVPIKRDLERYGVLASIYSPKQKLLLSVIKDKADVSMSSSPRATYEHADSSLNYAFVGYDVSAFDNLTFCTSYQFADISGYRKEAEGFESPDSPEFEYERSEQVFTAELKYNLESQNNRLIVGTKFRHKYFEIKSLYVDGISMPKSSYDKQDIISAFIEERYNISDGNIINLAVHYSNINNNSSIDDDNLLQLRLSHTYLYNSFVFKSFIYHTESLVEPYIYTYFKTNGSLKPQKVNAISQEIKYNYNSNYFRLFLSYKTIKNAFEETSTGYYTNTEDEYDDFSTYLEYTYNFDIDNKIVTNLSYLYTHNKPVLKKGIAAFIRSLNSINKFAIFNEIIFNRNTTTNKNYFDYSAGVKYHYNRDFTLSVKGENIFNTGYEESYSRVDPNTDTEETPILISPIEQRFYITIEYLF